MSEVGKTVRINIKRAKCLRQAGKPYVTLKGKPVPGNVLSVSASMIVDVYVKNTLNIYIRVL